MTARDYALEKRDVEARLCAAIKALDSALSDIMDRSMRLPIDKKQQSLQNARIGLQRASEDAKEELAHIEVGWAVVAKVVVYGELDDEVILSGFVERNTDGTEPEGLDDLREPGEAE